MNQTAFGWERCLEWVWERMDTDNYTERFNMLSIIKKGDTKRPRRVSKRKWLFICKETKSSGRRQCLGWILKSVNNVKVNAFLG